VKKIAKIDAKSKTVLPFTSTYSTCWGPNVSLTLYGAFPTLRFVDV